MANRRLTVIISEMQAGGAQRVLAVLMNHWVNLGWEIELLMMDPDPGAESFYKLDSRIRKRALGLAKPLGNKLMLPFEMMARIRKLKQAIRETSPGAVLSFLTYTNVLALLAARGLGVRVVVSERTDPAGRNIGRVWEILREVTYRKAAGVVCQGARPLSYFPEAIRKRGHIIPNPVILHNKLAFPTEPALKRGKVLIVAALGSLRSEKGFDILIEAFASVASANPHWNLVIWGEGPDRTKLEEFAAKLGIADRIEMPGQIPESLDALAVVDLFVLSSRVEGFPNVLAEAMSLGLPVIATDVGAVPEIVRDGVDALMIPASDPSALAGALDRLMKVDEVRHRLASRAPEVLDRFNIERVSTMWEELLWPS